MQLLAIIGDRVRFHREFLLEIGEANATGRGARCGRRRRMSARGGAAFDAPVTIVAGILAGGALFHGRGSVIIGPSMEKKPWSWSATMEELPGRLGVGRWLDSGSGSRILANQPLCQGRHIGNLKRLA